MTRLHFASALLPSGWANDVQVVITAGAIAEVTPGMAPVSGDERHDIAFPGLASLHSHAFQRGMAGLAELRGDSTDTFWTWRETMYRFALAMTPDDDSRSGRDTALCRDVGAGFYPRRRIPLSAS
ncbi:cytosine/adenosine deaminase-related metal-dependent hydrolase [Bradyrhizobium sp. GM5.1]